MAVDNTPTFYPKSQAEWRTWLSHNHRKEKAVWLIFCKKNSGMPTLSWSEAVDEALCFGWIDSKKQTIDDKQYRQFFCVRKPTSTWSKVNKLKITQLIEQGLMTADGLKCIEVAKANGSWTILDEVEECIIPTDLKAAFAAYTNAEAYFTSLSKSNQKIMLSWVVLAKRAETRAKRINEIVLCASKQQKPKQFS